ncbi:MAG: NFACT family protein [Armatimonadetes bacterium]|nr:NFACT family protein [Armatimonadota bacterium]
MPFDSVVMAAAVSEIRRASRDAQITKIYQPSSEEIYLHLRAGSERHLLLLSVHPQRFRLHFIRESPPNPASPPQFCMVLRKHLEGARLAAVEPSGLERIARFRFERSDGAHTLVAEMMGKHSNLTLLDAEGRILDSIKHVSGRINRVREILPGRPYLPPPAPAKPDPISAAEADVRNALGALGEKVTAQGIVKALANVGPFLAKEALARAVSPTPDAVTGALRDLMEQVRGEQFSPTLLLDEEGHPSDAWAFESLSVPETRQDRAPSMSLALEISHDFQTRQVNIERLRGEARERLNDLIGRAERRLREHEDAQAEAEKAETYRIMGEILQANAGVLERGQAEADLPNYYDPDLTPIRIELDPLLSTQENAEAYFRRHRKAKSSLVHLTERKEAERQKLEEWRRLAHETESAEEDRLLEILREIGTVSPAEPQGRREAKEEVRRPAPGVRRTQSTDGYEIWYGEHREGNDTLTTKLAAPTDLWLHVRAGASAHVVIRTAKKPEAVPHRTLVEAAKIAAAHSESKHAGIVPVDYTLKKYVRKPRGSGPGQALYTHEKTLHVEQE